MATGDINIGGINLSPEDLDKLSLEITNRLDATAKDPGQYEIAQSLNGVTSLPVFQQSGNSYKLVRVLLQALKGVDGKNIQLRIAAGGDLQWAPEGSEAWTRLYARADLQGKPGKNPVFREGATGLEYKLEGEDDTAYQPLIPFSRITGPTGDHVVFRIQGDRLQIKLSQADDTAYADLYDLSTLKGEQGETGPAPFFEKGTATTVAASDPADFTLEEIGVDPETGGKKYRLNFSLPKGDAFRYEDFTEEQLARLRGEKGDPFRYEDFTPEQLDVLKAPGHSPQLRDGVWWEWSDEAGDYVNTTIPANSDYELTKEKVEKVLTGDIESHSHASQLAQVLADYVRAVAGKQLSTEDFTTVLKEKLEGLQNYDDAAVQSAIAAINQRIESLVGDSSDSAIDTFQEMKAFLAGIADTDTLSGLLTALKIELTALIPTRSSQLQNDDHTVKDANYQHSDQNFTTALRDKLAGIAAGANNYVHPSYPAAGSGLYKITVDAAGHVSAAVPVAKADITALGIPAQDTNTVYTHPSYPARASGLYKVTVDAAGHVSAVAAVTKADITALGIPAQDTNTTYGLSTPSANGLMSAADKKKLDRIGSRTTASTVASLDVNYETILVTLAGNASLSANLTGAAYDGWETHVFVLASGANRTVSIPTTGSYISMCGSSVTIVSGQWCEFNLKCIGGIWHIAKLEQA